MKRNWGQEGILFKDNTKEEQNEEITIMHKKVQRRILKWLIDYRIII